MRRRVYVIAAEYSAHPRELVPARRGRAFLAERHEYSDAPEANRRLFFRQPKSAAAWRDAFGLEEPVGLADLLASAGHRALCTLRQLSGEGYAATRARVGALYVTSMPGLDPRERVNIGLVPQRLRGLLDLPATCRAQFLVGTSDSGAWAFAEAVRTARTTEQPGTFLVLAGQTLPSGYASQYQIRSVLGEHDQELGLDMLAAGDLWMDLLRRSAGRSRAEVEAVLAESAARKLEGAAQYPAALRHGSAARRGRRITPYFDELDVAPPCCGAVAAVVTTDESLVEAVRAGGGTRFAAAPVLEVLGVGDGSSNPNFLERRSPLVFTPAIRQALARAAADAGLPAHFFRGAAFGVLHDAFPSIELAFLVSLGLDWDEAAQRMAGGWSNPYGGLTAFGHAIGASGLVQVAKALHIIAGDGRHVLARDGRVGRRATCFTTSVGGPLSHIVSVILHAGEQPPHGRAGDEALVRWQGQRRRLRRAHETYHARRARSGAGDLVLGTTQVSVRSCLCALTEEDLARLRFDEALEAVRPERVEEARAKLRETIVAMQELARSGSQMFEVFDAYHDALLDHVQEWRESGALRDEASARTERELVEALKASLNAPMEVRARSSEGGVVRSVHVLAAPPETEEVGAEERGWLPFWCAAATRAGEGERHSEGLEEVVDALVSDEPPRRLEEESAGELALLRAYFGFAAEAPIVERAVGMSAPDVREGAVACVLRAVGAAETAHACEILAAAVERGRGWLARFETSVAERGLEVEVLCFGEETVPGERVVDAARLARDVVAWSGRAGVAVEALIAVAEGVRYRGADGARLAWEEALPRATGEAGITLRLEASAAEVAGALRRELVRWEKVGIGAGVPVRLG